MVHVVIADDDAVIRDLMGRIVTLLGWTSDIAVNGLQAKEMVEGLVPDLVVTDVSMSWMNGIDLLRFIKASPRLSQIPVVIMSATDQESAAFEGSAAAFIPKPFTFEQMTEVLAQVVPANLQGAD
jgi:CheY-like chemotaxis protein